MTYGVFDTVDNLWIGNDSGPCTYDDVCIAQIAAMMADVRLDSEPDRHLARPFPVNLTAKFRDELPTKMSNVDALKQLEDDTWPR